MMMSFKIDLSCYSSYSLIGVLLSHEFDSYLADFNLLTCDFVRFHFLVILKQCKVFIQYLVLDNDCCISGNAG